MPRKPILFRIGAWITSLDKSLANWYTNRREKRNFNWRINMQPGQGCYFYDSFGEKKRAIITSIRAGKGDVSIIYENKSGIEIPLNIKKKALYKY